MDVNLAAYHAASFKLTDPVLRYQLDPGEPGLLRSARASESIAAVSAQERGNLNQFKREAFLAGRVVISESITFTRGIDGLFNTVRAGLTEVVSIPAPSRSTKIETAEPAPYSRDDIELEAPAVASDELEEAIEDKEIELLSRLSALKNTIEQAMALAEKIEGEIPAGAADTEEWDIPKVEMVLEQLPEAEGDETLPQTGLGVPEDGDVKFSVDLRLPETKPINEEIEFEPLQQSDVLRQEQEMRELNQKLEELQMLRLRANIEHLSDVMLGAIEENINLLSNLVAVANRVGPDSHFNDLTSSVPTLGMVLDFSV